MTEYREALSIILSLAIIELDDVRGDLEPVRVKKTEKIIQRVQNGNKSYVRRILDISTAHVSEPTTWYLDVWSKDASLFVPAIIYNKGEYGWLVYVPTEPGQETEPSFPDDLRICMEY